MIELKRTDCVGEELFILLLSFDPGEVSGIFLENNRDVSKQFGFYLKENIYVR